MDGIAILICKAVPVAKKSLSNVIFVGPILRLMQMVFVSRERKSQRNQALEAIKVIILNFFPVFQILFDSKVLNFNI